MRIRSLGSGIALLAALLVSGCSDSSGPGTALSRIAGDWTFVSGRADAIGSDDTEAFDGFDLELSIQDDGDYAVVQDGDLVEAGELTVRGDSVLFDPFGSQPAFGMEWKLDDGDLLLIQRTEYDFDWENEYEPVPAIVTMRLARD